MAYDPKQTAITVSTPGQSIDTFDQMLAELRVIRMALVKLACDDYRSTPADFIEGAFDQSAGKEN